ncbi:MAG: endonuclease/exonuclease/phosphatase family protein [Chloroflexota bacterium]
MSFNIRGAFHTQDGLNAWENRAALNVATIQRHSPDLIGFQELQSGNLSVYEAELRDYQCILGNEASGGTEHPSIFWKPTRFDLLEAGGFWLSETPEVYSGSWGTDNIRAATWARFREKPSGKTFVHFNTHLDNVSAEARSEGLRLILQRMADVGANLPTILTGDFNCNAYQPPREGETDCADANYRFLLESGFVDSYLAAGNEDLAQSNTFHGFDGEQCVNENGRIDWILMRDGVERLRVLSANIIHDHAAPLYPSDHYPIVADVAIG